MLISRARIIESLGADGLRRVALIVCHQDGDTCSLKFRKLAHEIAERPTERSRFCDDHSFYACRLRGGTQRRASGEPIPALTRREQSLAPDAHDLSFEMEDSSASELLLLGGRAAAADRFADVDADALGHGDPVLPRFWWLSSHSGFIRWDGWSGTSGTAPALRRHSASGAAFSDRLRTSFRVAKQPKTANPECMISPATTLTAKEAKDGFGRLIDLARLSPVTVTKHQRPVVVVVAVEEFERLTAGDGTRSRSSATGSR